MYAGWIELEDGTYVTQYHPMANNLAIKPTTTGYELLEELQCGWFRHRECKTLDDAMRAASRLPKED